MVRVQQQIFRDILVDEVMETQYEQFGSADNSPVYQEYKLPIQAGMKRKLAFILYSVLVLLLLIVLMVTGIKFSQLNKEINDVKLQIERMNPGGKTAASTADKNKVEEVLLQRLTPVRGTCKEGWVSFKSSCYLLSTSTTTWTAAEDLCKRNGGHLLVLNDVEEQEYISKIIEIRYQYWIGLVEREQEGHWSWVDGTDFSSTPTNWDVGQPDNWAFRENGEDCGQLHGSVIRKRQMWNDADCTLSYNYICESRA